MSKRSGPERSRSELLKLAARVADGDVLAREDSGNKAVDGLRVIAALSQRLGTLEPALVTRPRRRPALFQWGHLDVIAGIGAGASAEVFRAYDPLLDVEVALKLSRPDLGRRATADWIAEARRLARLRHPNVVTVHGVDVHDGRAGLWLDLVEGETLAAYGERRGPLPGPELCLAGIELCGGLRAIHENGLLHRDLKPANLLREHSGRILIADFGAAGSAALAGSSLSHRGTPLAMAPELLEGGSATVASDLYSLGVVLHWLALGRLPVNADDLDTLRERHRARDRAPLAIDDPAVHPQLAIVLDRLLSMEPAGRPASAQQVGELLAGVLAACTRQPVPTAREHGAADRLAVDGHRLVAREAELAWLQQEQRRALLGRAHPILVAGESGTGKTALASCFGEWLGSRGGRLLRVALGGYPPGRRRLPTLLSRALAPEHSGTAGQAGADAMSALATRLLAESTTIPTVLCLDDLENADAAEQGQLRALLGVLRPGQVLVLGLLRAEARPPPALVTALYGPGPVNTHLLEAFTPAQTDTAIGQLLGAPGYGHELPASACSSLHRLSGGNPFFLSELIRHLVDSGALVADHGQRRWLLRQMPEALPASLELAALARCQVLPAPSRQLLDGAAVLGERFRLEMLARLLDQHGDELRTALQPALDAGLVEQGSRGYLYFRHGLIQRALYDALPDQERVRLHAMCAQLLSSGPRPVPPGWLSQHAERAGDHATAFASGLSALIEGQEPATTEACERMLALAGRDDVRATPAQRLEIGLRLVAALCTCGRPRQAATYAESLAREHRRRAGSIADLRLHLAQGQAAFALGRHPEVIAALRPLLADAVVRRGRHRDLLDQARLLLVRAQTAIGDYRAAEQAIAGALAAPPRDGVLHTNLQALYGWCIALQGRLREADEALDGVLRQAGDSQPAQRANILRRVHWVKLCRGRYQQAYALALAAHADFRSDGDAMGVAKMSMAMGQSRLLQGLPEEALGYLNRTVLRLEDIGDRHCEAETLWLIGRACTEMGRLDDADTQISQALQLIAAVGDRDDEFRFLTERARLRRAQGRQQEALAAATQARRIAAELDSHDGTAYAEVEMAAALLAQGENDAALALAEPAARRLRGLEAGEYWRADWLLGRARLTAAPDQPGPASAALASAHAACERGLAELDPDDEARRERIIRSRQPVVADHVRVLELLGQAGPAAELRSRWRLPDPA